MTKPLSSYSRCYACASYGLCAADCSNAPWNHDRPLAPSAFRYLLRQRRWLGSPIYDTRDVFFVKDAWELAFRWRGMWSP